MHNSTRLRSKLLGIRFISRAASTSGATYLVTVLVSLCLSVHTPGVPTLAGGGGLPTLTRSRRRVPTLAGGYPKVGTLRKVRTGVVPQGRHLPWPRLVPRGCVRKLLPNFWSWKNVLGNLHYQVQKYQNIICLEAVHLGNLYRKRQPVLPGHFSLTETELHQPVYKAIFWYFM